MKSNNLVTKPFLKKHLAQEFKKFGKNLKDKGFVKLRKKIRDEDLIKLRKEINSDITGLVDTAIIPLLETMSDDIKDIKDTLHKYRLDRHDDKFLLLAQ